MPSPHPSSPFHSQLIFDLVQALIESWIDYDGREGLTRDPSKIRLLRRIPEMTEGQPSKAVQDVYRDLFIQDVWVDLPPVVRRPGMRRQFNADHRLLATPTEE